MDSLPLAARFPIVPSMLTIARERDIQKIWVYMFIGETVAVCYASALFFAVLEASQMLPKKRSVIYASTKLVWATVSATLTTFFLYSSLSTPYFMILLLIVHALLFVPLLESTDTASSNISISQLYAINGILSALLHFGNCILLIRRGEMQFVFGFIGEKSAMSLIGWDVICSAVIGVIGTRRISNIVLAPVISLGSTMGGILSMFPLEDKIQDKRD